MSFRRVVAGALVVAGATYACSSFDASDADPAVDAGTTTDTAPPEQLPDVVTPPPPPENDAGVHWALHVPSGVDTTTPVGLATNATGGVHFGTTVSGKPFGTIAVPAGGAIFSRDGAGKVALAGVNGPRNIHHVAVDSAGDIYVVGEYSTLTPFSVPIANGTSVPHPGAPGGGKFIAYVAKVNGATGQMLWTWPLLPVGGADGGPPSHSLGRAIATRGQEVVVGFTFEGAAEYPSGGGGRAKVTSEGAFDGLVIALAPSTGDALWARQLSGPGTQIVAALDLDPNGNVVIGGHSQGALTIPGSPGLTTTLLTGVFVTLDAAGQHDVIAARAVTLTPAATGATAFVSAVVSPSPGTVVLCGRYNGPVKLETSASGNRGQQDAFLVRYAKDGQELAWVKTFGGTLSDDCTSVASDADGDLVMAVNHASSNVTVDGVALADPSSGGQSKGAVVGLGSDGKVKWVHDVVSAGPARVAKAAMGPNGDVFYAGYVTGRVDLGGGTIDASPSESSFFLVGRGP